MLKDRLYMFRVEKKDIDKEYYLLSSYGDEGKYTVYCLLHKSHAIKPLVVGEVILATVLERVKGKYFEVSQKVPQHLINVVKFIIPEEVRKRYDFYFDRAAALRKGKKCKIGVWGKGGLLSLQEIIEIIKPYYSELLKHMPFPIFIPSGVDYYIKPGMIYPESFVLNALLPFPKEKILDYIYDPEGKRVKIFLREKDIPLCMWKDYENVKLASKLTRYAYIIHNVENGYEIVVDPYKVLEEDSNKKTNIEQNDDILEQNYDIIQT